MTAGSPTLGLSYATHKQKTLYLRRKVGNGFFVERQTMEGRGQSVVAHSMWAVRFGRSVYARSGFWLYFFVLLCVVCVEGGGIKLMIDKCVVLIELFSCFVTFFY